MTTYGLPMEGEVVTHNTLKCKENDHLTTCTTDLYITEGEKKTLRACQEGLFCIGVSGLWNGSKELIPDFDLITLEGRNVYIVPDNDYRKPNKQNLEDAVNELGMTLRARGAMVFVVELPVGEKIGLDDYLCKYSVDELKRLPTQKIKNLPEMVAEATKDNYKPLLGEIAKIDDDIEKEFLIKSLTKRLNIPYYTVKSAVKKHRKEAPPVITNSNIIIAHPAYEIDATFMSIGFRETVVIGETPTDRNIYLIVTDNGYVLHEKPTFQLGDKRIVFEERDRLLINIHDRWDKGKLISFIKNPEVPEGLYEEIKQTLKEYIEFQEEAHYGLVASWIIATYFSRCFHAFPFLFFYGKKQAGKSRSLDFLERLAFNAMKIKGVSIASLADSIDGVRGTFLNDQAESLSDQKNVEILGILADSYTVGGGKRRIVSITNKSRRVVEFETYGPKAFASIKEIDADVKDRCVLIPMLRATRDYPYPEAHLPIWKDIRDKLYKLLLTRWKAVREIYQTAGEGVTQRVRELWKPIETILRLENVSDEEVKAIKSAFLDSMIETQTELSELEEELFELLFEILKDTEEKKGTFTVNEIASNLKSDGGMSEKGLQTWVGRTLRAFSLFDKSAGRMEYVDKNDKTRKGRAYSFSLTHVRDVYDRHHQVSGTGGIVVNNSDKQYVTDDHLINEGGTEVVTETMETTYEPPLFTDKDDLTEIDL